MPADLTAADLAHLRAAVEIAARARRNGNHPFGALLTGPTGEVLLEAENSVVTGRDCTGHAETNLMRLACARYERGFLAGCTLYTSTEPCPMCSAAIFWGGVGRVVYALSEESLYRMTAGNPANDSLPLPSREVLARGSRPTQVDGPAIEEEAALVHAGFWD